MFAEPKPKSLTLIHGSGTVQASVPDQLKMVTLFCEKEPLFFIHVRCRSRNVLPLLSKGTKGNLRKCYRGRHQALCVEPAAIQLDRWRINNKDPRKYVRRYFSPAEVLDWLKQMDVDTEILLEVLAKQGWEGKFLEETKK